MKKFINKIALGLMLLFLSIFTACGSMSAEDVELLDSVLTAVIEIAEEAVTEETATKVTVTEESVVPEVTLDEEGFYTSKEDVSLYLYLYGELPDNYITKKEAKALGWDSSKGNLWDVAPGMSIGGDYFGNYEGLLPEEEDRDYYECDIDYEGGYRNAKRIIFSDDGLIFYTEDHYESFDQLY